MNTFPPNTYNIIPNNLNIPYNIIPPSQPVFQQPPYMIQQNPYYMNNVSHNQQEKMKINNIVGEMLSNLKNRKRTSIDIESKSSNYFLLYTVDPQFRKEVCNIIKNVYNENNIQENQVNLDTMKHLLSNNLSEMEFLFNKYNQN